ncbi:retrotransposon protein, putative, ty1-copia subclass [Tanacetum coccineum]
MFKAKASKECLNVVKSLMPCKPKPRASIYAFVLEMKGYFDRLESLNMVFDAELSINIILSGLPADYNHNPVLTVGHNAKKRKTSHSNWKGKATQGKSDRGSKRKVKYEIAPTSDLKDSMYFIATQRGIGSLADQTLVCVKGIYETVECISNDGNMILNVGSFNELDKSKLWHSRLGHVNKKRIAQLQKDGVLESFDFKSDDVCESCLLGKMTKLPFTGTCERVDMNITSSRVSKPPQFYYGFHIEEDKISDSTLTELDKPANYKEAMASLEAAKWKEAMKRKIQSMYDNQV